MKTLRQSSLPLLHALRAIFLAAVLVPTAFAQPAGEQSLDSDTAHLRDIEDLLEDQAYSEGIRRLEAWLKENPEDIAARRLISEAYEDTGDAFRLRFHAKILNEQLPEDAEALNWLSTAEEAISEEYPAKVEELETALANDPQNRNLRRDLINLYLLGDRKDDAIREFKVLLAEDPENEQLILEYARNLAWMDQLEESIAAYNRYLQLVDEPTTEIRLERARVFAWNVQYREAVAILRNILDEEPSHLDARVLLGDIYRWNDDTTMSEQLYTYALERDPEHPEALAGMRALAEVEQRRTEASGTLSIDEMEERVAENPDDAEAIRQLARLYAAKNRYDDAATTYERYLELKPDAVPVYRDYAFCLSMEQRYDESIAQLRRYLETFPGDITVRLDIIKMLMWSERLGQAERELLSIYDYSNLYPEIIWKLARIEHIRANYPEAIAYYSQLKETAPQFSVAQAYIREIESLPNYKLEVLEGRVAGNPDDIESRMELALIYLEAERYWEARAQANEVLERQPGHVEANRVLGWAEVGLQEFRFERLRELRARLRENPNDAEAALEIARILRTEQNYEDAIRFYRAYLEQYPADEEVLEEYAMTMYWIPGYEMVAAEELTRLLSFRPDDIELNVLYLELMSRNDMLVAEDFDTMEALEEELDYRVTIDPEDPQPYYWFGRLSEINGKPEQAIDFYRYAMAFAAVDEETGDLIEERLEALESSPSYMLTRLERRAAENPEDVNTRMELAIYYLEAERYWEAREHALDVLAIEPDNLEAERAFGWAEIGIQELRFENMREMRARLRENPADAEAALELARLLRANESYAEDVVRLYRVYLDQYPQDAEVLEEYIMNMYWSTDYQMVAAEEFDRLLRLRPNDIDLNLRYLELVARNDIMVAEDFDTMRAIEEELDYRLTLDPEDPQLHFWFGRLAQINDNPDQALDFYRYALEFAATEGELADLIETKIDGLVNSPSYRLARLEERAAQNPNDINVRMDLSLVYLEAERYWEAREYAFDILAVDPDNVEAQRVVGWADVGLQELRFERLRTLQAILQEDPTNADAALELARLLRQEQNPEDAVRLYRTYLQQYPEDDEVIREYVMTMYWLPGYEVAAAEELDRLLGIRPNDIELNLLHLELLARNDMLVAEDFDTILAVEEELDYRLTLDPDNPQLYYWFGRLAQVNNDTEQALDLYYYALNNTSVNDQLAGVIEQRIGSIENSPDYHLDGLAAYLDRNPGDVSALLDLAYMQYEYERYFDVRDTVERILRMDPGNESARSLMTAADRYIRGVRTDTMEELRYAVSVDPSDMQAQLELAQLLKEEGLYEEARERYRIYLRSFPSDLEARKEYAQMLSWTEEHRDEAVEELRELSDMYPHDYEFQLQVARVMSWDRRYWGEAEERLERLSRLMGDDPEILIMQADLHRFQGRLSRAEELYDRVLRMTGRTRDFYAQPYQGYEPNRVRRPMQRTQRIEYRDPLPMYDTTSAYVAPQTTIWDRPIYRPVPDTQPVFRQTQFMPIEQERTRYRRSNDLIPAQRTTSFRPAPQVVPVPQSTVRPRRFVDTVSPSSSTNNTTNLIPVIRRDSFGNPINNGPSGWTTPISEIDEALSDQAETMQGPLFYRDPSVYAGSGTFAAPEDEASMISPLFAQYNARVTANPYEVRDTPPLRMEATPANEDFEGDQFRTRADRPRMGDNNQRVRTGTVEVVTTDEEARQSRIRPRETEATARVRTVSEVDSFVNERDDIPAVRRPDLQNNRMTGGSPVSFRRRDTEAEPAPRLREPPVETVVERRRRDPDFSELNERPVRMTPRISDPFPETSRSWRTVERDSERRFVDDGRMYRPVDERVINSRLADDRYWERERPVTTVREVREPRRVQQRILVDEPRMSRDWVDDRDRRVYAAPGPRVIEREVSVVDPRDRVDDRRFRRLESDRSVRMTPRDTWIVPRSTVNRVPDRVLADPYDSRYADPYTDRTIYRNRYASPLERTYDRPIYRNSFVEPLDRRVVPEYRRVVPEYRRVVPEYRREVVPNPPVYRIDRYRDRAREVPRPYYRRTVPRETEIYVPPVGRRLYDNTQSENRRSATPDTYETSRVASPSSNINRPVSPASGVSRQEMREDRVLAGSPYSRQPIFDEFSEPRRFYSPRNEVRRIEAPRVVASPPPTRQYPVRPRVDVVRRQEPVRVLASPPRGREVPARPRVDLGPRREPVRVLATPPPVREIRSRPQVQLQPNIGGAGFRQIGDTPQVSSRISPRLERVVAADPSGRNFASRAEAGLRSIDDQLRPQLSLFYGIEADTDDFFGQRIGGRYSHFLDGGTRLDLGLTYYQYEEDTGLSANEDAEALMLILGMSAPLGDRLSGSAELRFTDFSIEPDFTITGGVGASYALNTVNTISFDYDYYDIVHNVKTVRSLEEEITADRVRLSWNSNPVGSHMHREFWQRIYFEGNVSYASYSDSNSEISFLLRPYFRLLDDPALDLTAGFRSLSYDFESPFYWSPDSYSGPFFGFRVAGQTFWDLLYDIRAELFFPSSAETSKSLSAGIRKNFTENFSGGANAFATHSPRANDSSYSYYGLLLDLLYRF